MKTQNTQQHEEQSDFGLNDDFLKKYGWKDEDKHLLIELEGTPYWPAIQKYFQIFARVVDIGLRSTDPFKNPTVMAQHQGMYWVLGALDRYINAKKVQDAKVEEASTKK